MEDKCINMKNIILFLEDDASMRTHTAEMLKNEHYNVEDFYRIDQVKEYFTNNKDNIECIITDLNMNDEWLNDYQAESDGGMLSGWVWLQRFVYNQIPEMPTIIYSGYISYLKEYLQKNNSLFLLEKNNIMCVEKDVGDNDGFEGLLKALKNLIGD